VRDLGNRVEVLILGGAISAGKTTVAERLERPPFCATRLSARECLQRRLGMPNASRAELQSAGQEIEERTGGTWLADYLSEAAVTPGRYVVDAVRTVGQAQAILESFPYSRLVFLGAPEAVRVARHNDPATTDPLKQSSDLRGAFDHPIERRVSELIPLAARVIDTSLIGVEETVAEVAAIAGWGSSTR
jgi:hypothetical protein